MDTTQPLNPTATPMNRKTKYYYAHRDDPIFQQRMKEAKQRYYQKNREAVIQKTLARYYANKPTITTIVDELQPVQAPGN